MTRIISALGILICFCSCTKQDIGGDPGKYSIKGTWKITKHSSEIHDISGKVLNQENLDFPIEFKITDTRLVTNGPLNSDTTKYQLVEKGLKTTVTLEEWIPFTRQQMEVFYVKEKEMKLVAVSTDTTDITYKNGNANAFGYKFYMILELERQ